MIAGIDNLVMLLFHEGRVPAPANDDGESRSKAHLSTASRAGEGAMLLFADTLPLLGAFPAELAGSGLLSAAGRTLGSLCLLKHVC